VCVTEDERKLERECLRIASDLIRMATHALNPDLKAHCLRMAEVWSGQVGNHHT